MRALFIGGTVDNSELDLDGTQPPRHYPENTGGGQPRYRLHHVGRRDDRVAYAVYAPAGLDDAEVERAQRPVSGRGATRGRRARLSAAVPGRARAHGELTARVVRLFTRPSRTPTRGEPRGAAALACASRSMRPP